MRSYAITKLLTLAVLAGAGVKHADAQSYPVRPIRLVVASSPGGGSDILGRLIAQKLTELLGQQVVVENRAGASGIIGVDLVAKSPPDGYTLILTQTSLAINPSMIKKMPYEAMRDLAPISEIVAAPNVLVVHPSVPAKNVKELIALAKARPGQLTFASAGNASPSHLAGALFQSVAGVTLTHVPYKGGAPSVAAVIGGEVQLAIESPPPIVPQVKAGKLRALGAARPDRSPLLPDVPTVKEAGLTGFEVGSWYGFHAPAGTPKPIIDKLHAEMVRAMNTQELRDRFAAVGTETVANSPAQFSAFINAELKKWGKVISAAGVKAE